VLTLFFRDTSGLVHQAKEGLRWWNLRVKKNAEIAKAISKGGREREKERKGGGIKNLVQEKRLVNHPSLGGRRLNE